jgi:alpha-tubulin suppressor-like RCC1 family protein
MIYLHRLLSFLILGLVLSACENALDKSSQVEKGPLLGYTQSDFVFEEEDTVSITASIRGSVSNCSVEPALPIGLYLNSTTCSISGLALSQLSKTYYIVYFKNSYGESIPRQISLTIGEKTYPASVAMGENHSCALRLNGDVYCWGANNFGQLGDGTNNPSLAPVKVLGVAAATKIASFTGFSCALLENKTVKCWGENSRAQLGDGTTIHRSTPVLVNGLGNVKDVDVGSAHSCALLEDKSVRCWGYNQNGELGRGVASLSEPVPSTPIGLGVGVESLAVGAFQTCGVFASGVARCTGYNHMGQVGVGYTGNISTPTNVVGLPSGIKSMVLGREHACAHLFNNTVYCWGDGAAGQLGNGGFSSSLSPVQVSGLGSVVSLASGRNTICALLHNGLVYCWGANYYGKVGNGNTTNQGVPVYVPGINNIKAVISGYEGSCALKENLEMHCWGFNGSGQLGDGTVSDHWSPILINDAFN